MKNSIEINDLRIRYPRKEENALNGINLTVEKGEFVGIIGPTGAGKSTLCQTINGLIPQFVKTEEFQGNVTVLGMDTRKHSVSEFAEHVGIVFQDYETQIFRTNVELEVAFSLENWGFPQKEIHERIEKSLEWADIKPLRRRYTHTLSGGEKQRLAIASALAPKPEILVLDEATSDLDPKGKLEIYQIVKKLRKEKDITLIMVDHHLTRISEIADRIIVLNRGEIVEKGTPKEVFANVEELLDLGLRPPPVTEVFNHMNISSNAYPLTVEEAVRSFPNDYSLSSLPSSKEKVSNGTSLIEIKNLWHTYTGDNWVLKNINLDIKNNEIVGLVGQNGSGKTTLAQCLNGIVNPSKGSIRIKDEEATVKTVGELGKSVGYVFQNPDYMITQDTVRKELALGPQNTGCSEEETEERIEYATKMLNIEHLLDEDPFFLNRANRQRVAVGSITTLDPPIIILDEPTTGLAPGETRHIMELVSEMREKGKTIIVISHDLWIIAEYCDRVIALKDGELLLDGGPHKVFSQREILARSNLQPPQISQFSQEKFSKTVLTVKEFMNKLERG